MTRQTSASPAGKPLVLFLSKGVTNSELRRLTFGLDRHDKGIGYFQRRTPKLTLGQLLSRFLDTYAEDPDGPKIVEDMLDDGSFGDLDIRRVSYILIREVEIPSKSDIGEWSFFDQLLDGIAVAVKERTGRDILLIKLATDGTYLMDQC